MENIIPEKAICILLIRGERVNSKSLYVYLAITADRLEAFMLAKNEGPFFPEDFGIVLASGEGEPTVEAMAHMTNEYGFNHDEMIDICSSQIAGEVSSKLAYLAIRDED
ncbi:MAG: hypothetical protein EB060_11995 [Proteobacteria bacterium]|nr:hypothetical protein [Pseudomonadota bacterium]